MSSLPAIGHSVEFTKVIDEPAVEAFADLVDDHNQLFVDQDFAGRTRYGRRLVHGALLVGFVNAALTRLTGSGYVLMGQEIRFSAAVPVGDEVRVSAEVIRVREDKQIVSVETHIVRSDGESAFRGVGGLMRLEVNA